MTANEIIKLAANGNAEAEAFARAWVQHCQMLDNLYDRDKLVTDDWIAGCTIQFITEQAGNKFYLEHRAMFYGLMVLAFNAWVDANRKTGIERAVLSGMYHEVVYLVAYLTGGWQHLRHVTSECREYKGQGTAAMAKEEH